MTKEAKKAIEKIIAQYGASDVYLCCRFMAWEDRRFSRLADFIMSNYAL